MRLGIFIDGTFIPERDGASTRFANLPRHLSLCGVEVVVFHCYRGWSDLARIAEAPFPTYFFPPEVFYGETALVTSAMREAKVSLIQMNDVETISRIGYKLADELNLHLVFEAHYHTSTLATALDASSERVSALQLLEHEVCKNADHIIAFTEEDRNRWVKQSECPTDRVSVIPFGVDIPQQSVNFHGQGLVFLGNMYFEPNRKAVIRMAEQLLPAVRSELPDTPGMVVGDIPSDLRRLCVKSGIEVIGEVASPAPFLAKAAVGIAPVSEGSGVRVKILNYVAAGLPVVATSVAAEGVHFPSVFLANHTTTAAARCIDILQRPQTYLPLVKQTNLLIQNDYLWANVARNAIGVYDDIMRRNRKEKSQVAIQCVEEPMWIQEVLDKGRFPIINETNIGAYRVGIAEHGKIVTFQ